jgi:hypothetical protein
VPLNILNKFDESEELIVLIDKVYDRAKSVMLGELNLNLFFLFIEALLNGAQMTVKHILYSYV